MTPRDMLAALYPRQVPDRGRAYLPCPFHPDTRPSFVLYEDDSYHCFGCGAHGSARDLARALGMPAFAARRPRRRPRREPVRFPPGLLEAFHRDLLRTPRALAYLASRGVSREEAEVYRLGYAGRKPPEHPALRQAGWLRDGPQGPVWLAADALILPGPDGYAVARRLSGGGPKYLNPRGPKVPILLDGPDPVVLVEGYFDALAVRRAGFAACALLGSGRPPVLPGRRLLLLPDADRAGAELADRFARLGIQTLRLPEGFKDPAEAPPEAIRSLVSGGGI